MSRLTRDGTAEPVSRDQILRRERGQGSIHIPCSADHEQDWQRSPFDPHVSIIFPRVVALPCLALRRFQQEGIKAAGAKSRAKKWTLRHAENKSGDS